MILSHDSISQDVNEWAADYGIPAELITMRIAAGWTTADAIETEMPTSARDLTLHKRELRARKRIAKPKPTPKPRGTMLTHCGETLSVRQWSKRIGVASDAIHARIHLGMPTALVLTPGDLRASLTGIEPAVFITYRGITRSLPRWSRITGLKVATIRYRHARGWTPDRILDPNLVKKPTLSTAYGYSACIPQSSASSAASLDGKAQ